LNFDAFSNEYKQLLANSTGSDVNSLDYFSKQKIWHLVSVLKEEAENVASILDFGCGIGLSISPLGASFPKAKIIGCDISNSSLKIASSEHKQPSVSFQKTTTISSENIYCNAFDLIHVSCVLHHIPPIERQQIMEGLYSNCKTGGNIVIFEHNPLNPLTQKIVASCPFDEDAILLSINEASELLKTSGFKIVEKSFISFIPPSLKKIRRLETYFKWCAIGAQYFIVAKKCV